MKSISGLCPECLRTADSPIATPKDPQKDPRVGESTASAPAAPPPTPAPELEASTLTPFLLLEPPTASATVVDSSAVPLPASPPGYELFRLLGVGGMGAVYLAREVTTERLVAIKFLNRPGHQKAYDRFLIEVRVLAALDHPHITRVFSSDFLRSEPYFVMEYAAGGSLLTKLEKDGPFDPIEAARIVSVAARAVHVAHAARIIHRDIKPSNILLTRDGQPKLSDFGLAKRITRDDNLTTSSGPLGSPPYMAPEQTGEANDEEMDARTDVYGLGATLYHLVTGHRPFGGMIDELIRKVLTEPPIAPRVLCPKLPRELEAIILKCLEKNPARRYQSAEELARDLDKFRAGDNKSITAPLRTRWRRLKQWTSRHRRRVAGVGIALAALLVASPRPDPLSEDMETLKAGKSIIAIPERGLPRSINRPISGLEIGADLRASGACTLTSMEHGTLVVTPAMPIDRYTAEAEFCQLTPLGWGRAKINYHQWAGLLIGYDLRPTPDGGRLHSFLGITFSDFSPKPTTEYAVCTAGIIAERPGQHPEAIEGNNMYRIPFTPSIKQPGPWRKVKFVVAPDRVQAFWENDEGRMVPFADLDQSQIAELIASVHETMNEYKPPLVGTIPEWSPRRGIAIWCARSAFGVRNVVITPTPDHAP